MLSQRQYSAGGVTHDESIANQMDVRDVLLGDEDEVVLLLETGSGDKESSL